MGLDQGNEVKGGGDADKYDAYPGCNLGLVVSVSVRVVVVFTVSTHLEILLAVRPVCRSADV